MKWNFTISEKLNLAKFSEEFKILLGKYFNSVMYISRIQVMKNKLKDITEWDITRILNTMISNLNFIKSGNILEVSINPNIKTDEDISILSLIKLINYGSVSVRGTYIIDEAFSYVITMLTNIGGVL